MFDGLFDPAHTAAGKDEAADGRAQMEDVLRGIAEISPTVAEAVGEFHEGTSSGYYQDRPDARDPEVMMRTIVEYTSLMAAASLVGSIKDFAPQAMSLISDRRGPDGEIMEGATMLEPPVPLGSHPAAFEALVIGFASCYGSAIFDPLRAVVLTRIVRTGELGSPLGPMSVEITVPHALRLEDGSLRLGARIRDAEISPFGSPRVVLKGKRDLTEEEMEPYDRGLLRAAFVVNQAMEPLHPHHNKGIYCPPREEDEAA